MNRRDVIKQMLLVAGAGVSSSLLRAVASDEDLYVPPDKSKLNGQQRAMLAPLAELIIPTTDTPGAIAAGVPAFIDQLYTSWYSEEERAIFSHGLLELEEFCQKEYGRGFLECSVEQQTGALNVADLGSRSYQVSRGIVFFTGPDIAADAPFFVKLKHLTVLGYYMSEIGATEERVFKPMPHRFDGDYDFAKVGRQWSS